MQPRRSLRLVAGALVLALPLLSSCGFNLATDQPYTPAEGTNDRDGDVDVLAALVVAAQPGSGTFIATLSNNSVEDAASFESLAGSGEQQVVVDDMEPVEIPARGFVNLAEGGSVAVRGDFGAGDFLELTLEFGSGDSVTMEVPVVFACEEYHGLDFSADTSDAEEPTEDPTGEPTEEETAEPSETEEPAATGEPYDCETVHEE